MKQIEEILYPQLRSFPVIDRKRALRRARETPFDVIELLGMAAGLVLVTALTRYGVSELEIGERFALAIINFLVAVPLLAIALGPFIVRRVRRGLRAQLEKRQNRSGL